MPSELLSYVVVFLALNPLRSGALPGLSTDLLGLRTSLSSLVFSGGSRSISVEKRSDFDTNLNGSTFLWLLLDTYAGKTFFEYVFSTVTTPWP
jgi:hypothetical protein